MIGAWRKRAMGRGPIVVVLLGAGLAACGSVDTASSQHAAAARVAAGERLYRQGIDTRGHPLQARSMGDVPLSAARAACVSCHRPSGMGTTEGGYYVPPINGATLFAPRTPDRRRLFRYLYYQVQPTLYTARLHQPRLRPAYTLQSLTVALRKGIDAAGQPLATIMPRYRQLTDADVSALDAYLHTLSARPDPGVDQQDLQLATVVSDQVPADRRKAMLDTLRAYVDWHNLHLHDNLARTGFSPTIRSQFVPIERAWALSVWDLAGPADTWRAQLEAKYAAHPVFALIGGDVRGSWRGPAQFCDSRHLPCLFPTTPLPAWPVQPYSYTMYFSAGLALEAEVAARFLLAGGARDRAVLQLAAADTLGTVPAGIVQHALETHDPAPQQRLIVYHDRAELAAALRNIKDDPALTLVIWPGSDIQGSLDALAAAAPRAHLIVLPSRAIAAARKATSGSPLAARLRFPDPYELDLSAHAKSFETRAWLHARHLATDHIVLRFKAYYAMSLLDAALYEIDNNYYRDYLMERVEDESQKDLNPGMYPRLALSPGERFAAKVAEIVRLDPGQPDGLAAVGDWMTGSR